MAERKAASRLYIAEVEGLYQIYRMFERQCLNRRTE